MIIYGPYKLEAPRSLCLRSKHDQSPPLSVDPAEVGFVIVVVYVLLRQVSFAASGNDGLDNSLVPFFSELLLQNLSLCWVLNVW